MIEKIKSGNGSYYTLKLSQNHTLNNPNKQQKGRNNFGTTMRRKNKRFNIGVAYRPPDQKSDNDDMV